MKYIKYLIFILIIIPINSYAIELYCDRNVQSGSEFNCIISSSSNSLYSFNASIDYGEFSLVSSVFSDKYKGNISNNTINISGPGYNAATTMAVLTFKAPKNKDDKNYKIALSNIKYKYLSTDINDRVIDNSLISTITVKGDGVTIVEPQKKYYLTINHNIENISDSRLECLTKESDSCNINLNEVEIYKKEGYSFAGYSENTECTSYVSLNYSINQDKILYACYKKNDINNSNERLTLVNLTIDEITNFSFIKDIYVYDLFLSNKYDKVNINVFPTSDSEYEIKGNTDNLVEGVNTIEIVVKKGNEVVSYYININRGYIVNDKIKLNNIIIKGYELDFNPNKYVYTLKVKYNTKELELNPVTDNDYKYEIAGNKSITDGSIINIVVTDKEGTSNIYSIKIKYMSVVESYLYYIYAGVFSIFCLIVYLVVRYLKSDKYKEKKENKQKNSKIKKDKKEKPTKTKGKKEKIEKL